MSYQTSNTIFLIKPYNPYIAPAANETVHYIYQVNGNKYAVVETTLNWGKPELGLSIEEEDDYGYYFYKSFDEAMDFVKLLKECNR